jgi:hypothetical protein
MILFPRRGKYAKNAPIKEASADKLTGASASSQNNTKSVIRKILFLT